VPSLRHRSPNAQVWLPHLHLPADPPLMVHDPGVPALHAASSSHMHAEIVHENPGGQGWLQAPQWAALVEVFTHPMTSAQQVSAPPQAAPPLHEHPFAPHVWPPPQAVPLQTHVPTLHWPPLPQEASPTQRHLPPLQLKLGSHALPQPPQWSVLVKTSVSQPLSGLESQSPWPPGQKSMGPPLELELELELELVPPAPPPPDAAPPPPLDPVAVVVELVSPPPPEAAAPPVPELVVTDVSSLHEYEATATPKQMRLT
jgi:hypothetical protein